MQLDGVIMEYSRLVTKLMLEKSTKTVKSAYLSARWRSNTGGPPLVDTAGI